MALLTDSLEKAVMTSSVVNLRTVLAADDREFALGNALGRIGSMLAEGRVVEIVWPANREVSSASTHLGLSLAQSVLAMASSAAPGGSVIVHTRAGFTD